jgi:hypothetical protein
LEFLATEGWVWCYFATAALMGAWKEPIAMAPLLLLLAMNEVFFDAAMLF